MAGKKTQATRETQMIIDYEAADLVARLKATRDAIKSLQVAEAEYKELLEKKAGDWDDRAMVTDANLPVYLVNKVFGSNSNIKREKLLERGVNPEVIDYATNRVQYVAFRVSVYEGDEVSQETPWRSPLAV